MTETLTFEQIPSAISFLIEEVKQIKATLAKLSIIPPIPQRDEFIGVPEASEFLGVSVPTIYRKVREREIPSMKRGGKLYFSKDDLTVYLKEGRKKSNREVSQAADEYLNNL